MTRRKVLAALVAAPAALAVTQEPPTQAEVNQRNLVAAMVNFDHRWMDLVNDYVDKGGEGWDIKLAAEVEKYFGKMIKEPGWVSSHKI